jgi:hypothetical protein
MGSSRAFANRRLVVCAAIPTVLFSAACCAAEYKPPEKAAALDALKLVIAEASRLEQKVEVWVPLFGNLQRAKLLKADEKSVTVAVQGNPMDFPWQEFPSDRIAGMARSCLQENAKHALALADYYLACGQAEKADEALTLAAQWDAALGATLADRMKCLEALRTAKPPEPKGNGSAASGVPRLPSPSSPTAAGPVPAHASSTGPDYLKVKDLTPVKALETPKHSPLVLVRDGVAQAKVYVAEAKPRKNVEVLVQELVESVKLASGATLEVIRHSPAPPPSGGVPLIVIGDCEASRALGIDAARIPVEGYEVLTTPDRVFLVGSTIPIPDLGGWPPSYGNDGTAWAVADFLERFVNVRWYWPVSVGGRSVPEARTLTISPAHYTDEPVFRKREYFPGDGFSKKDGGWSPLWYDNKAAVPTERAIPAGVEKVDMTVCLAGLRQGFSWPYLIKVHDPQQIWKNQKLIDHHPDMFSKGKDGKPCFSMLCYSSPKTFDFLIAGCESVWDRKKEAMAPWDNHYVTWVTGTSATVSPFDMPLDCSCPDCQAVLTEKGGGPSKLMCLFVKKMCEEVKRRWPDKKVMFLPYWNYTWPADGVQFPDNLEIQLCTSTTGLPRNPQGLDKGLEWKISAWNKITHDKIQTWEYTGATNRTYALYQFPHTLKEYYTRNRALLAGSFINGGCLNDWAVYSITHHCWMKILWNPDVDVDAVMDVFCERMFGKASKLAREFLRIECDRYEKSNAAPGTGDGRENTGGIRSMFPTKVVAEMTQLWQAARQELKDDPVALQRFEHFTWTFEHFLKGYENSNGSKAK